MRPPRTGPTGAVGSVWGVGGLPHAIVGTEVAVRCVLRDAVAVFTVESAVYALLFVGAEELPINWDVRLVAGRPWKQASSRIRANREAERRSERSRLTRWWVTLNGDGEVAGATVSCRVSSRVLDQRLAYWEPRARPVAAGDCEAAS